MSAMVVKAGGLDLIVPAGRFRPPPHFWARLESALVWKSEGFDALAARAVAQVEDDLGVTPGIRALVTGGCDATLVLIRAGRQARRAALSVARPREAAAITKAMTRQLQRADIKARTGGKAGQAEARRIRAEIEQQRKARAEQAALDAHLDGLGALEALRGDAIEREPSRVRLTGRDGLKGLRDSGALTKAQHYAGLKYRDLYEGLREPLGSQLGALDGVMMGVDGEGDPEREKKRQQARWDKERKLLGAEAVAQRASRNGRGLTALRLVAGQGRAVAHFGRGGQDRKLYTAALVVVLTALAAHWAITDDGA